MSMGTLCPAHKGQQGWASTSCCSIYRPGPQGPGNTPWMSKVRKGELLLLEVLGSLCGGGGGRGGALEGGLSGTTPPLAVGHTLLFLAPCYSLTASLPGVRCKHLFSEKKKIP